MIHNIINFLSGYAFQNVMLFLTGVITIGIYCNQKSEKRKTAYRIIYLQIESIKENSKKIRECFESTTKFDVDKFWQTVNILESNEWNKYNHYFYHGLSSNEFQSITNYYNHASSMDGSYKEIRNAALYIFNEFYGKKANSSNSSNYCNITVPGTMSNAIIKQYEQLEEMEKCLPLHKLK